MPQWGAPARRRRVTIERVPHSTTYVCPGRSPRWLVLSDPREPNKTPRRPKQNAAASAPRGGPDWWSVWGAVRAADHLRPIEGPPGHHLINPNPGTPPPLLAWKTTVCSCWGDPKPLPRPRPPTRTNPAGRVVGPATRVKKREKAKRRPREKNTPARPISARRSRERGVTWPEAKVARGGRELPQKEAAPASSSRRTSPSASS